METDLVSATENVGVILLKPTDAREASQRTGKLRQTQTLDDYCMMKKIVKPKQPQFHPSSSSHPGNNSKTQFCWSNSEETLRFGHCDDSSGLTSSMDASIPRFDEGRRSQPCEWADRGKSERDCGT